MNHLYLVRHGENVANLTQEFSCRKVDYSLTPRGILQAGQTGEFFRGKAIDEIYTSPLKRARETANIIAAALGRDRPRLPVSVIEHFREVNVGDLEGQIPTAALWKVHNQVVADWKDGHPETPFPGGENYFSLLDRVQAGLIEILSGKEGREIVVVAHAAVLTFPLRDLCAGVDRHLLDTAMNNCAITELHARVVGDRLETRLLSFCTDGHMTGEAAQFAPSVPVDLDAMGDRP